MRVTADAHGVLTDLGLAQFTDADISKVHSATLKQGAIPDLAIVSQNSTEATMSNPGDGLSVDFKTMVEAAKGAAADHTIADKENDMKRSV